MPTTRELDSSDWPEVWQAAYRQLKESHTIIESQLVAWIQPLEVRDTRWDEALGRLHFKFGAPNDFSVGWIIDHHQKAIEKALSDITGKNCVISVAVDPELQKKHRIDQEPPTAVMIGAELGGRLPPAGTLLAGARTVATPGDSWRSLNPNYTFESFVVGASNQFAHASAIAVGEKPGYQYNPLFIYSPPGLGKTHLLHAIGNHVLSQNPKTRLCYASAEDFVNELIESLQKQKMPQFRTKYRDSFDVILIDDIQFIAGKKQTEEEFFHTFNALYGSKRQIILTSDRPPKEIEKLEERIRTRFEWGLVADIQPPEIETRIAILKAKAERDDIYLPDDVATFLATHIKSNVRELEGILIRLQAQSSLTGAEISIEMAKQEVRVGSRDENQPITIGSIQTTVASHFKLKIQDLKSSTRTKNVAIPRQIAMYLARKYTGLGYKDIGRSFGGKDHSTIMHACNKIDAAFENDTELRESVESIQNLL